MARQSTLPTIGLDTARDRWLARKGATPNTRRAYERTYGEFVTSLTANGRPLDDIDAIEASDIEAYIDTIPTASTRRLRYYSLRSLFTANKRHLTVHPFDMVEPPDAADTPDRTYLGWSDIYRMLDGAKLQRDMKRKVNNGLRDAAIINMLASSGLRRSELAGLHLDDIEGQRIRIRREIAKGAKERWARMDAIAAAAVADYIDLQRGRPGDRKGHHARHEPTLFLGLSGPLTGQGVQDIIARRAREAGVSRIPTPHEFRHRFKVTCADSGMSDRAIKALSGWLPERDMLDHYGRADIPRQAAEEYDRLWRRPARR